MKVPVLETERLLLRPLSLEDAEEIFQNWASDPEVARFMRWNTHQSVEDTREWLRSELDDPLSPSCYDWGFVCKTDGRLIGSGGLVFQEQKGMYELGYNLMKKYWNQGLATEAAREIVRYALEDLGQTQLFCCHAKENPASGRVMEKAGFVYQQDGEYSKLDNSRHFETKEYILNCL